MFGYDEWVVKVCELIKNNFFGSFCVVSGCKDGSEVRMVKLGNRVFIVGIKYEFGDVWYEEWDGEDFEESFGL